MNSLSGAKLATCLQEESNKTITSDVSPKTTKEQANDTINQSSSSSRAISVSNEFIEDSHTKKRLSTVLDSCKYTKKRRAENESINIVETQNEATFLPTTSSTPISNKTKLQINKTLNPCNKDILINPKRGMESLELINCKVQIIFVLRNFQLVPSKRPFF